MGFSCVNPIDKLRVPQYSQGDSVGVWVAHRESKRKKKHWGTLACPYVFNRTQRNRWNPNSTTEKTKENTHSSVIYATISNKVAT